LLVSGDDPPADVRWAAGPEVVLLGGLAELAELYDRVRVAISPTRFGAGVKLKTVEAIQHGVPVVCTPEAAAGLTPDLAAAAWVATDAAGFADAVVALATDRRTWQRSRDGALAAAGDPGSGGVVQWPAIIRAALADQTARRTR
jgi:glycosyltransferase involved in cell wall biosynthesis